MQNHTFKGDIMNYSHQEEMWQPLHYTPRTDAFTAATPKRRESAPLLLGIIDFYNGFKVAKPKIHS